MNHFQHRLCNSQLPPAPGDEANVDTLHVQTGRIKGTDVLVIRSFWKPDAEELKTLNEGGCVMLSVYGTTHAPLRLDAMPE